MKLRSLPTSASVALSVAVCRVPWRHSPRHRPAPAFTSVQPELLGVPNSYSSAWGDYDNDGDLDVYSTDRAGDNKLFQNNDGTFTHVFVGAGPTDARPTVGACWLDMDNDGDLSICSWPISRAPPTPCGGTMEARSSTWPPPPA